MEIEDITEERWDAVLNLNIKTIFFMIQKFLPYLRVGASPDAPKKVINIASIDGCGKLNSAYNYAYGVSKAGVIQLDRHLGDRLAWEGIQLNTISPGDFPTDLNKVARDHTEEMKKVTPAKRIGEKENIAGAAIFLASKAGNFSVGANIVVDGGMSVRGIQRDFYAKIWPDFVKLDR
jgi:2-deoxy-D-gluconate 3-dehydrogenase